MLLIQIYGYIIRVSQVYATEDVHKNLSFIAKVSVSSMNTIMSFGFHDGKLNLKIKLKLQCITSRCL